MELAMQLETITTEMIKPSKPTPPCLKSYKLSLLDQLFPLLEYSSPIVFFYNAPCRTKYNVGSYGSDTIIQLKESLSKTLSVYYPLTGRLIIHDSTINCNDEGVPLVVTRANCTLSRLLGSPNRVNLVPCFIPRDDTFLDPSRSESDGLIAIAFQISVFSCGGFAIGSQVINKALDGTSWAHFFMTWATIAKGGGPHVLPRELSIQTSVFPPVVVSDERPSLPGIPWVLQPIDGGSGGCVVKAFEFSPASIRWLQAMARSETVPNPTRVESVTCFLWKHFMAAAARALQASSSRNAGQNQAPTTSAVIHSVNMRPHLHPALPPATFGKFVTHAFAYFENKQGSGPKICNLVILLRQALSKAKDSEFLNKLRGKGRLEAIRHHKQTLEKLLPKAYFFTSLRSFDQANFGSGTPAWIGCTGGRPNSFFKNYIQLIHTSDHKIEAWIILDEKEMGILESNQEFLVFATPSEAPLAFPLRPSL